MGWGEREVEEDREREKLATVRWDEGRKGTKREEALRNSAPSGGIPAAGARSTPLRQSAFPLEETRTGVSKRVCTQGNTQIPAWAFPKAGTRAPPPLHTHTPFIIRARHMI